MNEDIVHEKVGDAIDGNTQAYKSAPIVPVHHSKHDEQPTWNGKNQKEHIVFFKEPRSMLMVVSVKIPTQTMHHVFVHRPSHEFHEQESGNNDEELDEWRHEGIKLRVPKKSS